MSQNENFAIFFCLFPFASFLFPFSPSSFPSFLRNKYVDSLSWLVARETCMPRESERINYNVLRGTRFFITIEIWSNFGWM